jgi:radical SAM protein with 4Fe4S-binding SPASM domain
MHELTELVSFLKDFGVRSYYLMHEDLLGRKEYNHPISFPEFWKFFTDLKSHLDDLIDINFVAASGFYKYKTNTAARCDAGITKISIMPDGTAFPCNLFARFKEFCLGNVVHEGIEKIWEHPVLKIFRRYDGKNRCISTRCEHHPQCKGGCPAHTYYFYGSIYGVDPRCMKTSCQ